MQGRLLELLARLRGARAILEIGTLGGYSTIWLARALPPDGRLVTLEADAHHARVARANLARAGLGALVEVVEGPALETLPRLQGPFDLVFIDADKERSADYLALALERSRPGTLIVADNVVRGGALVDAGSDDPRVVGSRRLVEAVGGRSAADGDRAPDRRGQGVGRDGAGAGGVSVPGGRGSAGERQRRLGRGGFGAPGRGVEGPCWLVRVNRAHPPRRAGFRRAC